MVIMRCVNGPWGVLAGHAPCSSVLQYSPLRIINLDNLYQERVIVVYGGIASMKDNVLTVLTSGADWIGEIDRVKAQTEREQAEQRLRERKDDVEIRYDQMLIRRSMVQMEVASTALIRPDDDGE